ncbi:MAG: discoidin domain-containing protein, partial [Dysgonamonadaceae bacterium]|nr:discoidin domain-containing protein [Dysgonamonadaceae bacterium]
NTGSLAGEEVVQIYLSAPADSKVWMPKKELRGFKRIALNAGETKTLTFHFCADDFYYWNQTGRKYEVKTGAYTIRAGGSSDKLPLSQQIVFKSGTAKPDLRITRLYTMPRYPVEGQPVSFYALVKNQGNAATTSTMPYSISFSAAGQQNVASTAQLKTIIAPGQVQLIASQGEWTAGTSGKIPLEARLAFVNGSVEWDTNNNAFTTDVEVFDPSSVASEYKNLAYLKEVTVSSEVGKYLGKQLVDGDLSTRWDSGNNASDSAAVDLAARCDVDKIELFWDTDYAGQYTLEKSTDGTAWSELKKVTAGAGAAEYHSFETFDARYIRICFTGRKSGATKYSLREMRVFGSVKEAMPAAKVILPENTLLLPHAKTYVDGTASTNPAAGALTCQWEQTGGPEPASVASPYLPLTELKFNAPGVYTLRLTVSNGVNTAFKDFSVNVVHPGASNDLAFKKPASASSSEKITMYPQVAVDGNDNTRWSSAHKNGEWWQVDLQHQVKPSQISILWHAEYAKKFNLQLSVNGTTWQTYATNESFGGGTSKSTNDGNVSGRYVRLNCVERSGQWENSIKTFNVYGNFETAANHLPLAKANGNAQGNRITLDATQSADADADPLTYRWEQIAGPAFLTIAGADKATATVDDAAPGSYYFKLTVDDGKDIDFTIWHVAITPEGNAIAAPPAASTRITAYPNPVVDHLYFCGDARSADIAHVYGATGALLASKKVINGSISLKELAGGLYYVCLYSKEKPIGHIKIIVATP